MAAAPRTPSHVHASRIQVGLSPHSPYTVSRTGIAFYQPVLTQKGYSRCHAYCGIKGRDTAAPAKEKRFGRVSIVLLDGTLAGRHMAIHQSNISRESVFSLPTSWLCMLSRLRKETSRLSGSQEYPLRTALGAIRKPGSE